MVTKLLLTYGANHEAQNANGNIALHLASAGKSAYEQPEKTHFLYLAMLNLLMEKGKNVNQKNQNGDTPLHIAASSGREVGVLFLLHAHSDINSTNNRNETPLFQATKKGHKAIVEILLKSRADVNIPDIDGNKCIDVARTLR
eukprot:TRINITY_DN8046_c0_g1_i2.p1 TRINITY_DN8046_c0_g1~~TRINITY_DN8046_c0_g1_i2.p1  ORF type:complete len:143 (-),score=20.70 TRINITY_DN8046_c0_g1_i2:4-432(-)